MSISYPSIIIGGLTSNTGSFSGSFLGNLSGSALTTQITSSLISGSEGYFEELYINGVPVSTGSVGISEISSSGNLTGSGTGANPVALKSNIQITSISSSYGEFGELSVTGTLTVRQLNVTYETSSVLYTSGSTKFGDSADDTHQFTGSLLVTGTVTADLFNGTASYALNAATASYVLNAVSSSYATTASYILLAESASYATTASYAINANIDTSSFATTSSNIFNGNQNISGNIIVSGTVTVGSSLELLQDSRILSITSSSGDGGSASTLHLIPDKNLTGSDQYVVIDPTSPNHIHLRAGGIIDSSFADIFLGGETANVQVRNGKLGLHELYLHTSGSTSGDHEWLFDQDGKLTIAGDISGSSIAPSNAQFSSVTSSFYGNLIGTASFATSASYVQTASYAIVASVLSLHNITGSGLLGDELGLKNDITVNSVTASYFSGAFYGDGSNLVNVPTGISTVYTSGSITGSGTSGNEIRLKDTVIINTLTASFISASSIAVDNSLIAFNTIDADVLQVNQESSLTGTTGISGTISLLGYATYNGVELNTAGGSGFPYTGNAVITGSLTVTNSISGSSLTASSLTASDLNIDYIDFVPQATDPTQQTGRIFVDNAYNEVNTWTDVTGVKLLQGQQLVLRAKCTDMATFTKGTVVRINGGTGANATFVTASWENDTNSADTLGFLMNSGVTNDFAYIIINGYLTDINTAGYTPGQTLYLSSSGNYTNVVPAYPYHEVRLGQVVRAHATVGSVFVRVQNGYELGELHDVYTGSLSPGDLLVYENSVNTQWTNKKQLTGSYGLTGSLTATSFSGSFSGSGALINNITASNISGFTNDVRDLFNAGANLTYNTGTYALNANPSVTSVTSSNGYALGSGGKVLETVGLSAVRFVSGTAGYVGIGTIPGLGTGLLMSGSATGSLTAPIISLSSSANITARAPIINIGDTATNNTLLNGDQVTVGATTLAGLYAYNGVALVSGSDSIILNASSSVGGWSDVNVYGNQLKVNCALSASSYIGLPPLGINNIKLPITYNQTTNSTVNTLVGASAFNELNYIGRNATLEIIGYVANSGSDTLYAELYDIQSSTSVATLSLSSSITSVTSSVLPLGMMSRLYEIYIKNSTGTGTVTLLAANIKID
jgi:hypothetical protein